MKKILYVIIILLFALTLILCSCGAEKEDLWHSVDVKDETFCLKDTFQTLIYNESSGKLLIIRKDTVIEKDMGIKKNNDLKDSLYAKYLN